MLGIQVTKACFCKRLLLLVLLLLLLLPPSAAVCCPLHTKISSIVYIRSYLSLGRSPTLSARPHAWRNSLLQLLLLLLLLLLPLHR